MTCANAPSLHIASTNDDLVTPLQSEETHREEICMEKKMEKPIFKFCGPCNCLITKLMKDHSGFIDRSARSMHHLSFEANAWIHFYIDVQIYIF